MPTYEYAIRLPLIGGGGYYEVCVCEDAVKAAAVVRALLASSQTPPTEISIVSRPSTKEVH